MIFLLYTWLFYMAAALSISIYRMWVKGTLNLLNKLAFAPVIIAFFLLDVVLNYTVLIPVLGLPPRGCTTMSDRFQVYHTDKNLDGSPYTATLLQKDVGTFICTK